MKKRFLILLITLFCVLLLPMQAMAAQIDPNASASLAVAFTPNGLQADGVAFRIYRVASVDADCRFTYTDAFAACGVSLEVPTAQTWTDLATMLPAQVAAQNIAPTATGETNATGIASFPQQQTGLYLVLGDLWQHESVTYSPVPFLVVIPDRNESGAWDYDVETTCKWTSHQATETVDLEVLKVWDDDENPGRPTSVQIQLYNGSQLYDTVTLSKENNWRHTWTGLPGQGQWSVGEAEVPQDYTVTVERQDNRFVVTNSCEQVTPPGPELPDTGQLWWPVPVLLIAGAVLMLLGMQRRRNADV